MDHQEVVWEGTDQIDLTQGREKWWAVVNLAIIVQVF